MDKDHVDITVSTKIFICLYLYGPVASSSI